MHTAVRLLPAAERVSVLSFTHVCGALDQIAKPSLGGYM